MQAYGPRNAGVRVGLLLAGAALLATGTGCSVLSDGAREPNRIEIPTQPPLSTQSSTPATPTTQPGGITETPEILPETTYEQVIKSAPRVSNADYREGATTPTGDRANAAGFHFSTPDRNVRCSTGNAATQTLACVTDKNVGPAQPGRRQSGECTWDRHYVLLDATAASTGACSNLYPVLYRSRIVGFGNAIAIDKFACLADVSGLYCIETTGKKGFVFSRDGFHDIRGDEQAAAPLLEAAGIAPENSDNSTEVTTTPR